MGSVWIVVTLNTVIVHADIKADILGFYVPYFLPPAAPAPIIFHRQETNRAALSKKLLTRERMKD